MKLKLISLMALLVPVISQSRSQNRSGSFVQPIRVEVMRNLGLDSAKSDLPVSLPREWGRLVSVQKIDATGYSMFLQNDGGEIYIVNLIQRGQYFYLNTYENGGVALVVRRGQ